VRNKNIFNIWFLQKIKEAISKNTNIVISILEFTELLLLQSVFDFDPETRKEILKTGNYGTIEYDNKNIKIIVNKQGNDYLFEGAEQYNDVFVFSKNKNTRNSNRFYYISG